MKWEDDPVIQHEMRLARARRGMLRSTLIWMPFFLASGGAFLFFLFDRAVLGGDNGGTWVLVVILGILALLFGFQAIHALRDYLGKPVVETGYVQRRWARNESLVIKTHYIRFDRRILRGDAYVLDTIQEGDRIEATFYQHSAVLIWAELAPAPPPEGTPPENPPG